MQAVVSIPCYALSYLINGDASGISEENKRNTDDWVRRHHPELIVPLSTEANDHQFFGPLPAWGLPCDVVECVVIYNLTSLNATRDKMNKMPFKDALDFIAFTQQTDYYDKLSEMEKYGEKPLKTMLDLMLDVVKEDYQLLTEFFLIIKHKKVNGTFGKVYGKYQNKVYKYAVDNYSGYEIQYFISNSY